MFNTDTVKSICPILAILNINWIVDYWAPKCESLRNYKLSVSKIDPMKWAKLATLMNFEGIGENEEDVFKVCSTFFCYEEFSWVLTILFSKSNLLDRKNSTICSFELDWKEFPKLCSIFAQKSSLWNRW